MEKTWENKGRNPKRLETLIHTGFEKKVDIELYIQNVRGKDVDKKFFDVGKYVESVTNRVESSFFALLGASKTVWITHI